MARNEAPITTKSANRRQGWLALASIAALVTAACSDGNRSSNSSEALREPATGSAAPAPQKPAVERLVVDCQANPSARYTMENSGHEVIPSRVGSTLIVGTIDEEAPATENGQPPVTAGIKLVYRGGHTYSAEIFDNLNPAMTRVIGFKSTDPAAEVSHTVGNASFSVETVPRPTYGRPHELGYVATVACGVSRT